MPLLSYIWANLGFVKGLLGVSSHWVRPLGGGCDKEQGGLIGVSTNWDMPLVRGCDEKGGVMEASVVVVGLFWDLVKVFYDCSRVEKMSLVASIRDLFDYS